MRGGGHLEVVLVEHRHRASLTTLYQKLGELAQNAALGPSEADLWRRSVPRC